jgi:tetratricopeptide (TPR) repeat protein
MREFPAAWAVAEALAEHWFAAGDLEDALAASVAAGDAAREVVALPAALGHYQRALDLWDRVAESETVTSIGHPVLLERAADVASGAGEHERAIRYIDAAIGELEHSAAAPAQIGLLCQRKGSYLGWAGGWGEVAEWTGRAAALVPSEPPTPERAGVLAAHALALTLGRERYEEASRVATAALEAARRAGARRDEVRAHNVLGICLVMTSTDPEAVIREFDQALAIGREIGDAGGVALASSNLTDALIRLGRLDEAAAAGLEAADIGVQMGAPRNEVGLGLFNAAEALFLGGRWDDCEHALERVRDLRAGGIVELWGLALIALLQASRGRDDAAAAAIADAATLGVVHPDGEGMLRSSQRRSPCTTAISTQPTGRRSTGSTR